MAKRNLKFYTFGDTTYCIMKKKGYIGVGTASYHESSIEDHPTRLVGETIAHLKAERDVLQMKLQDKKEQLKYTNNFYTYLFPQKYTKTLEDWLLPRADKYITKLKNEIESIEKEIQEIDDTIVEYLNDKKEFLKRLKKKRELKENVKNTSK